MVGQDLHCPKCGEMDMVQKVSAVYSGGTASGSYAGPTGGAAVPIGGGKPAMVGGYTTLVGSSQTYLSRRLTPPQKPSNSSTTVSLLLFAVAIGLFGCTAISLPFVKDGFILGVIVMFASGGIGIGAVLLANSIQKQGYARFAAQLPRWEKAVQRWNELYYCGRDDIVFIPGETGFQTVEEMTAMIYA